MKRILKAALIFILLTSIAKSQTVSTPNIGLEVPAGGSQNWNLPLNFNFSLLDQILGGTLQVPGLGVQLKPLFGVGFPTQVCTITNQGQEYFDTTSIPFQGSVCNNLAWSQFGGTGGGGGGGSFPGGIVFGLTSSTARSATASDVSTLISSLTGCTNANYLYSPGNGNCIPGVTSSAGLTTGFLTLNTSSTMLGSSNVDEGIGNANALTIRDSGGLFVGLTGTGQVTLKTLNFSNRFKLVGDGANNVTITDPLFAGDTNLNLDNLFLSNNLVLNGTSNIGNLTMQDVIVTPGNSLNSTTLILGSAATGIPSVVSTIYEQLTPTSISFPAALTTAGCLQTSNLGVVTSTGVACGTGGGGGGVFSSITSGINSVAAMVVNTGASLTATGSGSIVATSMPYSGLTGTVPTWNQDTTGTADFANNLSGGTPNQCTLGKVPTGILPNGDANGCFNPAGSVSGTVGTYGLFSGSAAIGNGSINFGLTTAGTNTSTVPFQINDGSGNGGTFSSSAGTSPSGTSGKSKIYMSSVTNQFMVNMNNFGESYLPSLISPAVAGDCVMFDSDGIRIKDAGAVCGTSGSSFTPTVVIDAGAGTGGSLSVSFVSGANDTRGWINVTTGTAPAASSGIVTIKYGGSYSTIRKCSVSGSNLAAAVLNGNASVWVPQASATTSLFVLQGGSTALAANTSYQFFYECGT